MERPHGCHMRNGKLAGLRFQPPLLEAPAELYWVLCRGFAPPGRLPWEGLDGAKALVMARRLDVAARIAGRNPAGELAREVGEDVAAELVEVYHQAAAEMARVAGMASLLAEIAAAERVPLLFLKFVALHLQGAVALGTRRAADVDLLVPEEAAASFQRALERRGFFLPTTRIRFYQLPAMFRGVTVEVHSRALRLCPPGNPTAATFSELHAAGMLERRPELPGECFVLARQLLLAHAVAHGIDQNALRPWRYPLLRMVADLVDLGFSPAEQDVFMNAGYQWIRDVVSVQEVEAAVHLAHSLASGRVPELLAEQQSEPAALLLRHVVASALDRGYVDSLRLFALFRPAPGDRGLWFVPRRLASALLISRSEMSQRYGTRSSRLGYLVLRLWRPLDLVRRFFRHVRMYVLYRLRARRLRGRSSWHRRDDQVSPQG